jgi:hypothetical protein
MANQQSAARRPWNDTTALSGAATKRRVTVRRPPGPALGRIPVPSPA